jgi:hypothetical protein
VVTSIAVRKSCGETNSAAVPLISRKIPLFGLKNSAVRQRSGIPFRPNQINDLAGRIRPPKGLNRRILLFFPLKQGNSMTGTPARNSTGEMR